MASPIEKLVHALSQLPGVGEKTATRLAFFILKQKVDYARELSEALQELHETVCFCSRCQTLTQENPCALCQDTRRDQSLIMVVETPQDLLALERSGTFRGVYHVLHGVLSPLEGVSPDDLKISQLLSRVKTGEVSEIILGTNPNVEGEATSLYLCKLLSPLGVKITQLASGMPVGGGIEYLDPMTLRRALEGRREIH